MERGVAIFRAAPIAVRSKDVEYPYRQDNDLLYLTGFPEPEATCVLDPAGDEPFTLFVRPRDRDREIWTGLRAGVEGAKERYGADAAYPIAELDERLPKIVQRAPVIYFAPTRDHRFDQRMLDLFAWARDNHARTGAGPRGILDPGVILHEMRLFKSDEEVAALERAIAIAGEAHRAAMAAVRPGAFEYEIEALIDYTFRRRGAAGPAYPSIVASGRERDRPPLRRQHAADARRRAPAGRRRRGVRRLLRRRHPDVSRRRAFLRSAAPRSTTSCSPRSKPRSRPCGRRPRFDAPHRAALEVLVDGLLDLGLLRGSRTKRSRAAPIRTFFMHRTSHWLGMDVHDVGVYHVGEGARRLEPGMVLTVEPGLYVAARLRRGRRAVARHRHPHRGRRARHRRRRARAVERGPEDRRRSRGAATVGVGRA